MADDIMQRAAKWISSFDSGISSRALFAHMMRGAEIEEHAHPHDAGDFGRCHALLKLIPEWRARIDEMAVHGPYWKALVERWGEIEATFEADRDLDPKKRKTYRLMRSILDPIREMDPKVIRLCDGVTMTFAKFN